MADYYFPTVVQPDIPLADITPLEQLLLSQIFEAEQDGNAFYFFEEQAPQDMLWLDAGEAREALGHSQGVASEAAVMVAEALDQLEPAVEDLELDLSVQSYAFIFQDIIRRSATLSHVIVTSALTCSKMRPDGFGGMVMVITADKMLSSSTHEIECELLDRAQYGELGCPPGFGHHVLLRLAEEHVRATVDVIFETEAPNGVDIADVTDDDIRQAALDTRAASDLSHEEGQAAFSAALAAIRIAAARKAKTP